MNVKDIVAIMEIEKFTDIEVGKLRIDGIVPKKAITFYTKEDFEEPKRKKFESRIKQLLSGKVQVDKGVKLYYLTVQSKK